MVAASAPHSTLEFFFGVYNNIERCVATEYTLVGVDKGVRLGLDFGFVRQIHRGAERKVQRVGVDDPGRRAVEFVDVSGKAFAVVFQELRVTDFLLGMGLLRAATEQAGDQEPPCIVARRKEPTFMDSILEANPAIC